MRGLILFLMILVLSLALSLNAEAIAIASDYLESNTMELIEGDSRIYGIRIQNPDPADSRANQTIWKAIQWSLLRETQEFMA